MSNPNKRKGDIAERKVRDAFRTLGFPHCERTRAGHPDDHGDMWLAPGVMAQVKDVGSPSYGVWLADTETQRVAGNADHAVLVHKRRGVGDPTQWYVVMTVEQAAGLLRAAGYGEPLTPGEPAA